MRNRNNTRGISYHAQRRRKRARQRQTFVFGIAVFAGVLLIGGIFCGIGVFAVGGQQIYPNVKISGVPVGDMTVAEAADKLDRTMKVQLPDKSVEVTFADGVTMKIGGQQAGLAAAAEKAADQAFEYGRNGNIITNTLAYLGCRFGDKDIDSGALLKADEKMIERELKSYREKLNEAAADVPDYQIKEDSIQLIKGKPGIHFEEQELAKAICQAFETGQEAIEYQAEIISPEMVDLEQIYDEVTVAPESAEYDKVKRTIKDHVDGFGFDQKEAQQLIDEADYGAAVEIPLKAIEAEVTTEALEKQLFPDILASSTTDLGDEPNEKIDDSLRTKNVELAADTINGTILEPGDRFAFNKVVGQRTAERGYNLSDAYAGTEIVAQLGGGICQVSSTMYHALLHTNIQIDKRRYHTLPVSYLPLGMDATVSWGSPEFAFTNNTGHPVKIEMVREGEMLTARFHGTKTSDIEIEPRSVTISTTPFKTAYKDEPSLPENETKVDREGVDGAVVDVYKDYKDADGKVIKSVYLGRDTYQPITSVVLKGTGKKS